MKYWLMFCIALLASCSGGTTPNPNPIPTDGTVVWTPPSSNTPLGEPISGVSSLRKWLDSTGGEVVSPNGLVRVIAPSGALPNGSWVTIAPVTSNAPNALGVTHRIELEALTNNEATAPITLEFSTSEDASSSDFTALRHNSNGDWQMLPNAQVQVSNTPVNKKVRVNVSSNGDYALAAKYKLHPSQATVRINASLPMTVLRLSALDPNNNLSNLEIQPVVVSSWAVNGAPNGTSGLGIFIASDKPNQRTYKAPSQKPKPNPVTVSAKVGASTYVSSITIEDSEGWVDGFATARISRGTNTPNLKESLNAEFQAQYTLEASQISAVAPTTIANTEIPGYVSVMMSLKPKSVATASVQFTSQRTGDCICTPNTGKYSVNQTYSFRAADELQSKDGNLVIASGEIQKFGAYDIDLGIVTLLLTGDFEFEQTSNYPCGNDNPFPAVKLSGKDVVTFTSIRKTEINGTLHPQGPDSVTGTNSDHSSFVVFFPSKIIQFGAAPATSIFSWFFPYNPAQTQIAPLRPQSPAPSPFSSPVQDTLTPQPRC
jgi:hypothetical protein